MAQFIACTIAEDPDRVHWVNVDLLQSFSPNEDGTVRIVTIEGGVGTITHPDWHCWIDQVAPMPGFRR